MKFLLLPSICYKCLRAIQQHPSSVKRRGYCLFSETPFGMRHNLCRGGWPLYKGIMLDESGTLSVQRECGSGWPHTTATAGKCSHFHPLDHIPSLIQLLVRSQPWRIRRLEGKMNVYHAKMRLYLFVKEKIRPGTGVWWHHIERRRRPLESSQSTTFYARAEQTFWIAGKIPETILCNESIY